jgi:hypothetical protein
VAQYALDQATAGDRHAERSFKRDFHDADDCLPALLSLSKTRALVASPAAAAHAASSSADPFPAGFTHADTLLMPESTPAGGKPVDLDSHIWQRFLHWFESKASAEHDLALLQAEHRVLRSLMDHLQGEHLRCASLSAKVA